MFRAFDERPIFKYFLNLKTVSFPGKPDLIYPDTLMQSGVPAVLGLVQSLLGLWEEMILTPCRLWVTWRTQCAVHPPRVTCDTA